MVAAKFDGTSLSPGIGQDDRRIIVTNDGKWFRRMSIFELDRN